MKPLPNPYSAIPSRGGNETKAFAETCVNAQFNEFQRSMIAGGNRLSLTEAGAETEIPFDLKQTHRVCKAALGWASATWARLFN